MPWEEDERETDPEHGEEFAGQQPEGFHADRKPAASDRRRNRSRHGLPEKRLEVFQGNGYPIMRFKTLAVIFWIRSSGPSGVM